MCAVIKSNYNGYLRINGTKEFLVVENGICKYMVYSKNHMYINTKETDCYDAKGNYLGVFKSESHENKEETKELYNQKNVIQLNYEFKLLPIGRCVNQDEVYDAEKLIKTCFNINPLDECTERVNTDDYLRVFHGNEHKSIFYKENFTPFEVCTMGHKSTITNKTNKTIELDIKGYTENKNNFIKKNPQYKEDTEKIYNLNIGYLCLFWGVTKENLLKDNFNKQNKAFKKLNKIIKQNN